MLFQLNDCYGKVLGLLEIDTKLDIDDVCGIVLEIGQYCIENHPENFWEMVETQLLNEEGILSASRTFLTEVNL